MTEYNRNDELEGIFEFYESKRLMRSLDTTSLSRQYHPGRIYGSGNYGDSAKEIRYQEFILNPQLINTTILEMNKSQEDMNQDFEEDMNQDFEEDINHDFEEDINHDFEEDINHDFEEDLYNEEELKDLELMEEFDSDFEDDATHEDLWVPDFRNEPCCNGYINRCVVRHKMPDIPSIPCMSNMNNNVSIRQVASPPVCLEVRANIQPCRYGWGCFGRASGKCPFIHPSQPTKSNVSVELRTCRYGWGCFGRASGKCPFNHPSSP
jgi:hypothetical protein